MRLNALLVLCSGAVWAQASPLRIMSIEPTALFPNREPLRQIAKLELDNAGSQPLQCRIAFQLAGSAGDPETRVEVPPGASTYRLLIPDIPSPAQLDVEVRSESDGRVLATHHQEWQPQRHWKVYVVKSSHEDLGYENYIFAKQHDIANYMDLVRRWTGRGSGYHYTLETLLFERNYIEERSETAWRELVEKQVKPGYLPLMGAPSGVHSHWMDYEELARMTYPGRREMLDRFGLDLKTFNIVDNPSVSWSGCQAVADAGFRYVARWGQGWRSGGNNDYRTTKLPALFWWVGPDGKSKVLFGWRSHYSMGFWYGAGGGYTELTDLGAEYASKQLKAIESGAVLGPYPYDAVVTPEYSDHEVPSFNPRALDQFTKEYRYPEIHIASPQDFFEYIERKYGEQLPALSGDLNNFSADYATIDPDSQGWKRRAARLLPLAEGVGAIASTVEPGWLPPVRLVSRTFMRLFDYDEHSWPTQPEASDVQLFNAQYLKKNEAKRAIDAAERTVNVSLAALVRHVPAGAGRAVIVFNPLAHERTDMVEVAGSFSAVTDPDTRKVLTAEALPDGGTVFIAPAVPAFGYKVFQIAGAATAQAAASALSASGTRLSNQYYRIQFDGKTGAIRGIYDKELKRELVDPAAAHRFNEMIYLHTPGRESPEGTMLSPAAAASMAGKAGRVRAEFTVKINDGNTGAAVTQTVILYDGLKRIDIVDDLHHARALYSAHYEDRYRDNIYYAFPVKVEGFEARAEYPGGVVRPYVDQLRWGSHDYLYTNRWVDVSNTAFGVTMAPWNAGTVNFGEIRYNQFSIDYRPTSSHLYSYAYSNRMASLLTLNGDDCNARLGYSFTSHAGNWDSGSATAFGWSVASPLEARILSGPQDGSLPAAKASFLRVNTPNVELVTLKTSEQPGRGWVARLVETEGRDTDVVLELPRFPISAAWQCDLVENDRGSLAVEGHKVKLRIGKYAFATVRISSAEEPGAVAEVHAEALSDKSVKLAWSGTADAYNIYRSEDPAEPPTIHTLEGRATQREFTDDWLKIGTAYYYRVAPVSRDNNQGTPSAPVAVATKTKNLSPPAPVEELGLVRRAKDRLVVYWRTNPEPDVARYYVYRAREKHFSITSKAPLATVSPARYFLQLYSDNGLEPGGTYYYKVVAEDWAGNRQIESPVVWATTPAY